MAHNVTHEIKGTKLIITVDIGTAAVNKAPPSKTGKTALVGSTGGSVKLDGRDGMSYSLNVMNKLD